MEQRDQNTNSLYEPKEPYSNANEPATYQNPKKPSDSGKTLGVIVVVLGVYLLLKSFDFFHLPFVQQLVSIPSIMLVAGIILGARDRFAVGSWMILAGFGAYFLLRKFDYNLSQYVFPLIVILAGIALMKKGSAKKERDSMSQIRSEGNTANDLGFNNYSSSVENVFDAPAEFLKIDSYFSNNMANVQSLNLQGANLTSVFGTIEFDCKAAKIQQDIVIDLCVVCGTVTLILPANWHVVNQTTSIIGNVEDKRKLINQLGNERRVVLTGFSVMGSIEIKNI